MEKIVDRIRKLLALAGNNTSEAEREAALGKAHAMLLEHNLSMADLGRQEEIDMKGDAAGQKSKYRSAPWNRYIASAIAGLYFCKYYWRPDGNGTLHTYVGTRADAMIAHAVTQMVLDSVWNEAVLNMKRTAGRNKDIFDFCNSAARTVWWRCDELKKAVQAGGTAESTGRALVVVDLYKTKLSDAQKWIDENIKLRNGQRRGMKISDSAAAAAGASHGKKVQLTMSVAPSASAKRIK